MQLNAEWVTVKDALHFACPGLNSVLLGPIIPAPIFKSADTHQETLLCL